MDITLTEIRFSEGVWTALVDEKWQGDSAPEFTVSLQGKNVSRLKAELKSRPKSDELSFPIPSEAIAKRLHTVIKSLVGSSDALAKF